MAYTIDLDGKVALITGAAKGIGLATAKLLAQAGAQVVIDDIVHPDRMGSILTEFAALGKKPAYLQIDITKESHAKNLIDQAVGEFGKIDILVNNAGVVADWDVSYAVHVKGLFFCSKYAKEYMQKQKSGRIINITSTCVLTGGTGIPQYVATKAGAYSLTRFMAKEYAPLGIMVNGVMPAVIMSDMVMTRYASEQEMIDHYIPQMPIRRIGYPKDVANIVLFLSSDLSNFINGEIIVADGGRMYVG